MSVQLVRGNALDLPLADSSVDLVVTSPPYFGLRSYQDDGSHYSGQIGSEPSPAEFVDALIAATGEMVRVLKPSGSIWLNLGDKYSGAQAQNFGGESRAGDSAKVWAQTNPKNTGVRAKSLIGVPWRYALRCIDDLGLILRAEVIWSKPNGLPESVTDRVRRSHETWFHFVREPRYFSSVDEIREPHNGRLTSTPQPLHERGMSIVPGNTPHRTPGPDGWGTNPLGKLPGSVWTIATQPLTVPASLGVDHFAAFPMAWPRRIISGWCPPFGTVLDSFGGTGTTALVADSLGRHGISVDMSADYCRLAAWRTTDPGQRASALQVDKTAAVDAAGFWLAGQIDLFGGAA